MRRFGFMLVALCTVAASSGAAGAVAPTASEPGRAASLRAAAEGMLAASTLTGVVDGVLSVRPGAAETTAVAAVPSAATDMPPLAGVPAPLRAHVADLYGTLSAASVATRAAWRDAEPRLAAVDPADLGGQEVLTLMASPERLRADADAVAHVAGLVDGQAFRAAARAAAQAVDRVLPELETAARARTATGIDVDGCDVAHQPPALCIGGEGDNTYTTDYALLIDLGGKDTYRNSAGGADLSPHGNGLPFSVSIDLAGDDRYLASMPTADGSGVAQGGGTFGGIGVLVDAAGNDVYDMTMGKPELSAWGQGAGLTGVGILADLGGNDRSTMTDDASAPGDEHAHALPVVTAPDEWHNTLAMGQGAGYAGGVGVAYHAGGDDTYLVSAEQDEPLLSKDRPDPRPASSQGFGMGALGGIGGFVDDGGTDEASVPARQAPIDPRVRAATVGLEDLQSGTAAFGLGLAGSAVSVWGDGPTVRTTTAASTQPHVWSVMTQGFGTGALGGVGLLYDAGGDDRNVTRATSIAAIDTACPTCETVRAIPTGGMAIARGMGMGVLGGFGALLDDGGNDHYEASAESQVHATATDDAERPASSEPVVVADARGARAEVTAQAIGWFEDGAGMVLDVSGDDVYDIATNTAATAAAMASDAANAAGIAETGQSVAWGQSWAQANESTAHFADHGGADAYRVIQEVSAAAQPEFQRLELPPQSRVMPYAELGGTATFRDAGSGADTYTLTPESPVCEGQRGGAFWKACSPGVAVGFDTGGIQR